MTSDADTVQRDTVRGAAALSRGVVVYRSRDASGALPATTYFYKYRLKLVVLSTSPFTQIIIRFIYLMEIK